MGLNNKRGNIIGLLSIIFCMLFFAPIMLVNPVKAEGGLTIEAEVLPYIAIQAPDEVAMTITPKQNGEWHSESMDLTIKTNSQAGYTLSMGSDGSNSDMAYEGDNENAIKSDFNGSVTSANMGLNKWGFSLNSVDYNAMPVLSDNLVIKTTDSQSNDTMSVYYGVKVNLDIPSGKYSDVVVFTAVANSASVPESEKSIFDITTMQEMTPLICSNTTTPSVDATEIAWSYSESSTMIPRTALTDTRDGTVYLVSKLADGNCWMSQNLELDLDLDPLTSEDTDLNTISSWTPINATHVDENSIWNNDSWDTDRSTRVSPDHKYLINGSTPSDTASASGIVSQWERTGNYYNWVAATAGGTMAEAAEQHQNSICPKGWTLPSNNGTQSLKNLIFSTYGIGSGGKDHSSLVDDPLNFTYSGNITSWSDDYAPDMGQSFAYWTGETSNGAAAYMVSGNIGWGFPQQENTGYKAYGAAVRCVARAE